MYNDFKAAIRALTQRPGYTGVIIVTLAVIIGCNTAMFTMLNAVLLRPIGYVDPDRLVMLWENNRAAGQEQSNVSGPAFKDWRERTRAFQAGHRRVFVPSAGVSGDGGVSIRRPHVEHSRR